jgi:hypothetical protein
MFLPRSDFTDVTPVEKSHTFEQPTDEVQNTNSNIFSKTLHTFSDFVINFLNKHPITLQSILVPSYNPFDPFNLRKLDRAIITSSIVSLNANLKSLIIYLKMLLTPVFTISKEFLNFNLNFFDTIMISSTLNETIDFLKS